MASDTPTPEPATWPQVGDTVWVADRRVIGPFTIEEMILENRFVPRALLVGRAGWYHIADLHATEIAAQAVCDQRNTPAHIWTRLQRAEAERDTYREAVGILANGVNPQLASAGKVLAAHMTAWADQYDKDHPTEEGGTNEPQ